MHLSETDTKEFIKFACLLAEESGKVIRQYFRTNMSVEKKDDQSPVTIADRKAEELMRRLILDEFPEHGVIGEEMGIDHPNAQYKWVLDPIDGTKNFICGGLAFGTLIAVLEDEKPILGVIHQPILNELLLGTNSETSLNGAKVHVRPCHKITEAILLTTDPFHVKKYQNGAAFNKLRNEVKTYQGWGDCYGYFLLATGRVDIMVDPILNFWDIMPLIPIIRGAGGTITDYQGRDPLPGNSIVASGGAIHTEVIKILNPSM